MKYLIIKEDNKKMKTKNAGKKVKPANQFKHKQRLKIASLSMVFIIFAAVGINLLFLSHAAGSDSLTLSPSSGTYTVGSTLSLNITEDSTDNINAIESDLNYNSSELQFNSVGCSSTFALSPQATGGNGSVKLACAIANSSVKGVQTVGTVKFTVLSGGNSVISFASTCSIVDQANDTNNWNGITTGGVYTISTAPTTSITSPLTGSQVHAGDVPITTIANDTVGISKVELLINGTLYATDTTSPYNFIWDTLSGGYPNGSYTLTTIAFNTSGLSTISTNDVVKVNNGDVNGDGTVNISDLSILASNWGKSFGSIGPNLGNNTTFSEGDLNEDNSVSILDLSILASNWGTTD